MNITELEAIIKNLGFQKEFYWIQAENLFTSGLQVQSIRSENKNLIQDLANETGLDYTHYLEDATSNRIIYFINFF